MTFDILIRNGLVVDGTGEREPFCADIGISGDRIVAVGDLASARAIRTIDAKNRAVSPGFIDVHVHSELALLGGRDRFAGALQGMTTQLLAPDGFGWTPLGSEQARQMWDYTRFGYGDVEHAPGWETIEAYLNTFVNCTPLNVCPQAPHCAVRFAVMGWDVRPASDDELKAMEALTRDWMAAGAAALSLGLDYQPAASADLRELVALSRIVASHGGICTTHQRYHTLGRKAAWEETLDIARQSGIPVHISHERADDEIADILDRVDREDIDLTFEAYLYPAGMTHMTMMLPMAYQQGSPDEVLQRLKDPAVRENSLSSLRQWLGRCDQTVGYTRSGRYIGLTLTQAAAQAGKPPAEFAYDLILEEDGVQAFVFPWQVPPEEATATVDRTARHPRVMIASDGIYNIPHPHPRSHGCFARVLGHVVRERNVLSLRQAVHKMAGFPARRFGLKDRGVIAEGKAADLVIFDPETIAAGSTFEHPIRPPVGIDRVIVNGQTVIENGQPTGKLPGRVLRRSA